MKFKVISNFLFVFLLFFISYGSAEALSLNINDYQINENKADKYIKVSNNKGNVTYKSNDESIFTVDSEGIIAPKKDGVANLIVKDDEETKVANIAVNAFGEIEAQFNECMKNVPTNITVPFTSDFTKLVLNVNNYEFNYGMDMLYGLDFYGIDAKFNFSCSKVGRVILRNEGNNIVIGAVMNVYNNNIPFSKEVKLKNEKILNINYRPYIEKDAAIIENAKKNVKKYYSYYMNDIYNDLLYSDLDKFNEIAVKNSNFIKDLGNNKIQYKVDFRRGDISLSNTMAAGFIQLGMNDTIYSAVGELEFHRKLLIPQVKEGENIIDVIEKYFRENFLKDGETVEVTTNDNIVFNAKISSNNTRSLMRANNDKNIAFEVEEESDVVIDNGNNVVNPNTGDNILQYVLLLFIGIFGMVLSINSFSKKEEK